MRRIKPCGPLWEIPRRSPVGEHLGIIKTFVRGNWFDDRDRTGQPGLFERQRFSLRRLYDLRLGADYRLDPIAQKEAQWAIQVAQDVIGVCGQRESSHETKHEE